MTTPWKKWYSNPKNREKYLAKRRADHWKNREKELERGRAYYQRDLEKSRQKKRLNYYKHKESVYYQYKDFTNHLYCKKS